MASLSRFKDYALAAGVIAALILGGIGTYAYANPGTHQTNTVNTVWDNQTIQHNSTVYRNTTVNTTTPIWHNTTVWVNTTHWDNTTNTVYRNSTVYVNTTIIELIPVVNVTGIFVNYTNATLGVNATVPIPENYSLPVGTVTWVLVTVNVTKCCPQYDITVNAPWVLLSDRDCSTPETITVDVLLGVPYWPGTYPIDLTVSK
jgi:hypothetical protein